MRRLLPILMLVLAAAQPTIASAESCSKQIQRLQQADRLTRFDPDAGPSASQSIGAQLGHQPTPSSIARGEAMAQSRFRSELARAKTLNRAGDVAGCKLVLARARDAFTPVGR